MNDFFQAKIRSRNEFGLSAETILDLFQTFDIRDITTESTTNIFQKISFIENNQNLHKEKSSFLQEDEPSSSTIGAPPIKNDVVNSEPLSTLNEKGKKRS